jgi:hypothetical protein
MKQNTPNDQLVIPPILRPLLESLTREALQNKPNDLIEFGRLYFETFLAHRSSIDRFLRRCSGTKLFYASLEATCSDASILQEQAAYDSFRMDLAKKVGLLFRNLSFLFF